MKSGPGREEAQNVGFLIRFYSKIEGPKWWPFSGVLGFSWGCLGPISDLFWSDPGCLGVVLGARIVPRVLLEAPLMASIVP